MPFLKKEKVITRNSLILKISSYCAYQERTQQEVREKLYEYGADKDTAEELIAELITQNFINEERFAKAYAGGKFRMKKWGRMKILRELENKGLSSYCVRKAMEEIDEKAYSKTLVELLEKKSSETKETNPYKRKHIISRFAISKGFEPELVWETLNEFFSLNEGLKKAFVKRI